MNKLNSSIYLFPIHSVFNPQHAPAFENFNTENSVLLYSALTENHKELFDAFEGKINTVYVFDHYYPAKIKNILKMAIFV